MPRSIRPYLNAKCLKCGKVKRNMAKYGALIMCVKCYKEEFKNDDSVTKERETYLIWLGVYNKY